jgi:hypothetical protein
VPLINPPDILPEAMRFLLRALLGHKHAECDRDELLALVAPAGLGEALKAVDRSEAAVSGDQAQKGGLVIAQRSLEALGALKLVEVREGRVFALDTATAAGKNVDGLTACAFAHMLRAQIWRVEADGGTSAVHDLVSALAVMFAAEEPLEPFYFEGAHGRRFDMIQSARFGAKQSDWSVGNSVQWPAARRWAIYLGLGSPIPATKTVQSTGLIVEASQALQADLDLATGTYQINAFLQRCADVLPIADGGAFTQWSAPGGAEVSPGMSLTLRQLEALGSVSLETRSDTTGMTIALGTRPDLCELVTHLNWHPGAAREGAPR